MQRTLISGLLDFVPGTDHGASKNRRDLRRIDHCLGSPRWWRSVVAPQVDRKLRVLEIGTGPGDFNLLPTHLVDGLDRSLVGRFEGWRDYPVVIGNRAFHHFSDYELRKLGTQLAAHARIIVSCEPRRARRFQRAFALLGRPLGVSAATRRGVRLSIYAGFRRDELPRALGLDERRWRWSIDETWRGAYRMIASVRS